MHYRKLGSTGIQVSEIGFGTWGIGGVSEGATSYGPTDDKESLATLKRAFDLGITFYDTADVYGNGRSEMLLSRAFHKVREKVIIASKVGFLNYSAPQNFSPDHIRTALGKSLERLQTDYLDLYQLHGVRVETLENDDRIVGVLSDLKKEGKIRFYGISVKSPNDGIPAINKFGFSVIQINFNMMDQRAAANGLLNLAHEKDVGIIVRTPLNFGFLSGKVSHLNFHPSDHRSTWSQEQLRRWADAPHLFSKLNEGKERTLSQLALRFCLAYDSVSTIIPGMMHPSEVDENVKTSDMKPLDESEILEINKIYKNSKFMV